jgi:hypothetical protein
MDRGNVDDKRVIAEWGWEGNVQQRIVEFLKADGWNVVHEADAALHDHGPDIDARKLRRPLLVEVKGYPSTRYRDPRRIHERKRTNPRQQARHWFAQAFLEVLTQTEGGEAWETAMGLPEVDVYEGLVKACESAFRVLGIGVYFVRRDGSVYLRLEHRSRGEALHAAK